MFHRSAFTLPDQIDGDLDERIDKHIDRLLVLALQYDWGPTGRLASVHRSIKAWYLDHWDGDTEWVTDVKIDRDLEGLACALRKAIPDVYSAVRQDAEGRSLHHYFGTCGAEMMEELSAELEENLAQAIIDAGDAVTSSGVIIDLFTALYGHSGTIDLHGSQDQGARSDGTPLPEEALESRSSLGGELPPNG